MSQIETETIDRDLFMNVLGGSLDVDEARDTLQRAADYAGLAWQDSYPRDAAIELADALTELEDAKLFVNISGNTIKARIENGNF